MIDNWYYYHWCMCDLVGHWCVAVTDTSLKSYWQTTPIHIVHVLIRTCMYAHSAPNSVLTTSTSSFSPTSHFRLDLDMTRASCTQHIKRCIMTILLPAAKSVLPILILSPIGSSNNRMTQLGIYPVFSGTRLELVDLIIYTAAGVLYATSRTYASYNTNNCSYLSSINPVDCLS